MLLLFFPARQVPILYGLLVAPGIALMWLSPPLYSAMLRGPDLADADFQWVNTGLAIASGLSSIFIIAIFVIARRRSVFH